MSHADDVPTRLHLLVLTPGIRDRHRSAQINLDKCCADRFDGFAKRLADHVELKKTCRMGYVKDNLETCIPDRMSWPSEKPFMPLDHQAKDFLDRLAAAELPPIQEQTVAQARAQMDFSTHFLGELPRVAKVEDRRVPGPGGDNPGADHHAARSRAVATAGCGVLPWRRLGAGQYRVA